MTFYEGFEINGGQVPGTTAPVPEVPFDFPTFRENLNVFDPVYMEAEAYGLDRDVSTLAVATAAAPEATISPVGEEVGIEGPPSFVGGLVEAVGGFVERARSSVAANVLSAVGMVASFVAPPLALPLAIASLGTRVATAAGFQPSVSPAGPYDIAHVGTPDLPEEQQMPFHQTLLPTLAAVSEGLGTVGTIAEQIRGITGTSVGPPAASQNLVYQAAFPQPVRLGGSALALGGAAVSALTLATRFLRTRGFTVKRFKQLVVLVGLTAAAEIVGLSLQDAALIATKKTRRRRGISAAQLSTTRRTLRRFQTLDKQLQDVCKRGRRR